jgi:hypothetical protein
MHSCRVQHPRPPRDEHLRRAPSRSVSLARNRKLVSKRKRFAISKPKTGLRNRKPVLSVSCDTASSTRAPPAMNTCAGPALSLSLGVPSLLESGGGKAMEMRFAFRRVPLSMVIRLAGPAFSHSIWALPRPTAMNICAGPALLLFSSDAMYQSNGFRKSTPPQNRQLNISISNNKQ